MVDTGSSSRQPSGSRVGSATAVEALKAFTCLVTATLGDAHAHQLAVGEQAQVELSAEEAFGALQKLALQRQEPAADPIEDIAGGCGAKGGGGGNNQAGYGRAACLTILEAWISHSGQVQTSGT